MSESIAITVVGSGYVGLARISHTKRLFNFFGGLKGHAECQGELRRDR